MAITEYYVDPSINANSGSGTSGDPYGDLQYAMDQVGTSPGRNTQDGDRFNIKAGTAEVLSASLNFTTYGTPNTTGPIYFRGYTSTSGDGGIGEINCNGNSLFSGGHKKAHLVDLEVHNGGTNDIVQLDFGSIFNCEVHNTSGDGIACSDYSSVCGNHVHNIGRYGIYVANGRECFVCGNYIYSDSGDTNTMSVCLLISGAATDALRNIIYSDGTAHAIEITASDSIRVVNNSVWHTGTGPAIELDEDASVAVLINNLVKTTSTGVGIDYEKTTLPEPKALLGNNAVHGTNKYNGSTTATAVKLSDENLTGSPFAESGSNTFANRFTYFAPADVGSIRTGGYPFDGTLSKGAVQSAGSGGGGGLLRVNMNGGMS